MVITTPHNFGHIQDALEAAGLKAVHAEVTMHLLLKLRLPTLSKHRKLKK